MCADAIISGIGVGIVVGIVAIVSSVDQRDLWDARWCDLVGVFAFGCLIASMTGLSVMLVALSGTTCAR